MLNNNKELNVRNEQIKKIIWLVLDIIGIYFFGKLISFVNSQIYNQIVIKYIDGEFLEYMTIFGKEYEFAYGVPDKIIVGAYFAEFFISLLLVLLLIYIITRKYPNLKFGEYYYLEPFWYDRSKGRIYNKDGEYLGSVKNPFFCMTEKKFFIEVNEVLKGYGKSIPEDTKIYLVKNKEAKHKIEEWGIYDEVSKNFEKDYDEY